jgi:CDP-diacylglycerol--serine O-phosphatidyltransferase
MNSIKYIVPNGFTGASMLFGLASVVCSGSGNFELAAWMILWGVLLDKLDGASARLLNASSDFGVQFDSFADFVIFGIAPAALFFFKLKGLEAYASGTGYILLLVVLGAYVLATSARLARFNISEPPGSDVIFFGLPTTLVGAALGAGYLTISLNGLGDKWLPYAPIVIGIFAVGMVSNLRLPKLKARKNKLLHWFQIANIIAVYIMTPLQMWPEYLFILANAYMFVGLIWGFFNPVSSFMGDETREPISESEVGV